MPLNPKALGLAVAIIWATTLFIGTLLAVGTGYASEALELWGTWHPGYSISIMGAFAGLIYGAICGFIVGYLLAWLYNRFEKRFG